MFNQNILKLILSLLAVLPLSAKAFQSGAAVSYGTGFGSLSDPDGLNGLNLAYLLQPDSWEWGNVDLSLNLSYGYWKTTDYAHYQTLSTYGLAPVLRWYFFNNATATPFLQGSIGAAVLSNNYFGDRALGSNVLFQDQGGIGLAFGADKEMFTSLQMLHYSNAGLAKQNSGFTAPCFITLGAYF